MAEAFLCEGFRTPIGRYGGSLSAVRPDDMLGHVIGKVMEAAPGLAPEAIEDVLMMEPPPWFTMCRAAR